MESEPGSRILYCDANCVIVNKIPGEACEGAGKGMIDLPQLLSETLAAAPDLSPAPPPNDVLPLPTAVHRLDVPVSGCAVFARTGAALRFLNDTFGSSKVKKMYWAIVEDKPRSFTEESKKSVLDTPCTSVSSVVDSYIELTHWIQFDPKRNKSIAHNEPGPGRKKAILRYRPAGRGRDYVFLEVELVTGRHHQIRAQLERMGLHIKGDLKYSARRSEKGGGIRLHARSITFPNPADGGKSITVQADPPLLDNLWQAFKESCT